MEYSYAAARQLSNKLYICKNCTAPLGADHANLSVCRKCGVVADYNPFSDYTFHNLTMTEKDSYGHKMASRESPDKLKRILDQIREQIPRISIIENMMDRIHERLFEVAQDILLSCCKQNLTSGELEFVFPIPREASVLATACLLIAAREYPALSGTLSETILRSSGVENRAFDRKVRILQSDLMRRRAICGHQPSSEVKLLVDTANRECNHLNLLPKASRFIVDLYSNVIDVVICDGRNPRFTLAACIFHVVVGKCDKFHDKLWPRGFEETEDLSNRAIINKLVKDLTVNEKLIFDIEEIVRAYHDCKLRQPNLDVEFEFFNAKLKKKMKKENDKKKTNKRSLAEMQA